MGRENQESGSGGQAQVRGGLSEHLKCGYCVIAQHEGGEISGATSLTRTQGIGRIRVLLSHMLHVSQSLDY